MKFSKRVCCVQQTVVVHNKLFWKTVKPLLSDKVAGKDKIHLIDNNELVKTDLETAEVLNAFFFPNNSKEP